MRLEVIYEDEHMLAINKPHGLLVHKTKIAKDAKQFALQLLRDQVGYKVFPAHRLDRKTSGVLVFSKNKMMDSMIQQQFMNHKVEKTYLAIVRGWLDDTGEIDHPIGEALKKKEAITKYQLKERFEIDVPLGKHETSRYSLLEIRPLTGRFHQIRKHMAHIFHPIIGDRPHGCSKQNRMWKNLFAMEKMMLHASELKINLPESATIEIKAPLSNDFNRVLEILKNN
ncbi:pseudouridine synthase [Portibacter marinus]|uniref:pseudouridine synthase n=1 Tax=Portibacter marinus TaxID=2898660 RepID=UPI001F247811|nr:pseudouridine synthase [Portibacter marinus]